MSSTPPPDGCVELTDGTRQWRTGGQLHRPDGPAVVHPDGRAEWWLRGVKHRLDGPAVDYPGLLRAWWVHGRRDRATGPAIEHGDGGREWWRNDQRHRVDGPAVEYPSGGHRWWVHGVELTGTEVLLALTAAGDVAQLTAVLTLAGNSVRAGGTPDLAALHAALLATCA